MFPSSPLGSGSSGLEKDGLLFSVISRGTVILARYAARVGNFAQITDVILSKIDSGVDGKRTYSSDNYLFHYICSEGIIYLCITDSDFDTSRAFFFLKIIKLKFSTQFLKPALKTALPYAVNSDFAFVLCAEMKRSNNKTKKKSHEDEDKIERLREEVDQVRDIMVSNIDSIVERGEKLELLMDKTENLTTQTITFKQNTQRLSRKVWWENVRWSVFGGVFFLVFIYVIIAVSCGGLDLPNCV